MVHHRGLVPGSLEATQDTQEAGRCRHWAIYLCSMKTRILLDFLAWPIMRPRGKSNFWALTHMNKGECSHSWTWHLHRPRALSASSLQAGLRKPPPQNPRR